MKRAGADLTAWMEETSANLADTASEEDSRNTPPADPFSDNEAGANTTRMIWKPNQRTTN
jgi:hypothetical protein